jgi:hypothetical protein
VRKRTVTADRFLDLEEIAGDAEVGGTALPRNPPRDQRVRHSGAIPSDNLFVARRTAGKPSRDGEFARTPLSAGLLPPLETPETGMIGSLLYPLRGAETMAMAAAMGTIFWGAMVLVPEYCLGIWADASTLGTPSMGMLIILISAIPVLLLFPLLLIYILQYLGRVLVSSARGDCLPPRMPDRNFEGFLHGLSPWLTWLVLGAAVGLLPCALLLSTGDQPFSNRPFLAWSLVLLGMPYALAALMLSFLHDRPLACAPPGVLMALLGDGGKLLPTLVKATALIGLGAMLFLVLLMLRDGHFWVYLLTALPWWVLAIWIAIVDMRLLGLHYHRHKETLKWHGKHPRWGIKWRL